VGEHQFTDYFENSALTRRPYLKKEWCVQLNYYPDTELVLSKLNSTVERLAG